MKSKITFAASFVFLVSLLTAQPGPWLLAGNILLGTEKFGSTNAVPVNFFSNNVQRMQLDVAGNLGIGGIPNNKLDVFGGDIDVNQPRRGYMINDLFVLRHKAGVSNIFVGVGAGFNHPFNSLLNNTFVGNNAGFNNTIASNNTFIGFRSGFPLTIEGANTFVGSFSGENIAAGSDENVLLGFECGQFMNGQHCTMAGNTAGKNSAGNFNSYFGIGAAVTYTGSENSFFGTSAGAAGNGNQNVFFGNNAGISGVGSNNVVIGYSSAFTHTSGNKNTYVGNGVVPSMISGTLNTFVGADADATNAASSLTNSAVFGANAKVTNNDHMILGDNNVNIGIGLSSDPTGPQKKLEINETAVTTPTTANTTIPGTFGGSGLRFTKLTSATTPTTNPGNGLLGVNATGDVIYVDGAASGGIFGSACSATAGIATLPNNRRLEMAGFDINFTVPTFSASQVNLGYNVCATNPARINVYNDFYSTGALITSSLSYVNAADPNLRGARIESFNTSTGPGNNDAVGLSAAATASGATASAIAGNFFSIGNTSSFNYGIQCNVVNASQTTYGARFNLRQSLSPRNIGAFIDMSLSVPSIATSTNIGVFSVVQKTPSAANIAGYFTAVGSASNIGVYAQAPAGTSTITPSGPHYAGYFNGDVIRTGADNFTSDQMLKQNLDTISNALGIINLLKPKIFEYKQSSFPSMSLPGGKHYGLIAQETQTVLPELVHVATHPSQFDSTGNAITAPFNYLTLEYQQLTPILIRAIQQLSDQNQKLVAEKSKQDSVIQTMQSQIAGLSSSVSSCCSSSAVRETKPSELNQLNINLSDKDVIVLNQNVPNPFAEQTTITYNLPEKYNFAQIIFSTIEGKIIKAVDITKKGRGQINVFANDLSSGMYTYSFVVDGKVIDTKKMVKSE